MRPTLAVPAEQSTLDDARVPLCDAARVSGSALVWLLPAALALVDWYAVARHDRRTESWAKPATLVALIVAALVLGATDGAAGSWLLVGLVLGLAGDVFLLGDSDPRFRLGLAAFLIGHLAYVACFVELGVDPAPWAWLAWVVLLGCLLVTRRVAPATYVRGGAPLAVPVALYTVVIGAMVLLAFDTGVRLIALGATVFAASDSILAVDRFVRPRPWARVGVIVTYHLGQALVVAGVLTAS
jgi:uncharacterized membrane protein YhhN